MDLIDILRTFRPNAEEYTFFSSAHGTFSRTDHILGHKPKLLNLPFLNLRKLKLYQASSLELGGGNGSHLDVGGTLMLQLECRRVCWGTT